MPALIFILSSNGCAYHYHRSSSNYDYEYYYYGSPKNLTEDYTANSLFCMTEWVSSSRSYYIWAKREGTTVYWYYDGSLTLPQANGLNTVYEYVGIG